MIVRDFFCGAGGAATGIHKALEEAHIQHVILGIDIRPQPHYPFECVQGDALNPPVNDHGVLFDWYSPPCHKWVSGVHNKRERPDCLTPLLSRLRTGKIPYCIENVPAAPLYQTLHLCGTMFSLLVLRHRIFETSFHCQQPRHPRHHGRVYSSTDHRGREKHPGGKKEPLRFFTVAGKPRSAIDTFDNWKRAMGVDWECTPGELTQMVPPAYSHYIIQQFLASRTNRSIIRESGPSRKNVLPEGTSQ